MEVRAMEYRPHVLPTGVVPNLQDYHAAIPELSPPRSQGSSTGGASSLGDFVPRMYTPPTPPTPHDDDQKLSLITSKSAMTINRIRMKGYTWTTTVVHLHALVTEVYPWYFLTSSYHLIVDLAPSL
ncbi:hypothetical protein QAD02_022196 [Eretmocerus hayati]|uniref:Uncharacterized protein n=1 Tax=Eretmocerus hayati TaxID=131215 RepID=A0ACC2PSL4_9HYME|nr:hypothetical protein QAD02_022196 [Eretmocerus hayati]